jgi:hypothetical protein
MLRTAAWYVEVCVDAGTKRGAADVRRKADARRCASAARPPTLGGVYRTRMPTTLAAFFDRFRRAFAERNLDVLGELVHCPCLVVSERGVTALSDPAELRRRLALQCSRHAEAGVAEAEFEVRDHRRLDARVMRTEVRWTLHDAQGDTLSSFELSYLLVSGHHGWRVAVVAPHEALDHGSSIVSPWGGSA